MKNPIFKRFIASFLTGAMALTVCMSTAMPAFAANEPLPSGTLKSPAEVAITKVLQMPEGTATPTATFTFHIVKVSVDDDFSAAAVNTMPDLTGSIAVAGTSNSTVVDQKKIITMNTGNILQGKTWPHAGEYIYTVKEAISGYTIADSTKETLTYSLAEYELHVYIAEGEGGALYVKSAGAIIKKDQTGGNKEGYGEKVDPSVPATVAEGNNFKFVNTYTKAPGGGEGPNPKLQSVAISKAVAGELASKTKYFPFEVTITNNSLVSTASYKAYICTLSGGVYTKVSNTEANNKYDTGKDYVTFKAGTKQEITLKHGQYLVFMDCPQGTIYNANEKAVPGYKSSVHIVIGGTAVNPDLTNTASSTALSTNNRIVTAGGANTADFTNTYATTVPTGIIIENLPFIIMILVAIGAFTAFIVNKRRKMVR